MMMRVMILMMIIELTKNLLTTRWSEFSKELGVHLKIDDDTWTCSFSTLLVSVTVLVQWSLNLLFVMLRIFEKGFSTALDNKMMHNMHQIGIMMCVNIVAQIFENTLWANIFDKTLCANILKHLVCTSPSSWKAPDDPESLFNLKDFEEQKWAACKNNLLATVWVFCNKDESCETVWHRVNQVTRQTGTNIISIDGNKYLNK